MRVKLSIGEIECRDNRNSAKPSLTSQSGPKLSQLLSLDVGRYQSTNHIIRRHRKLLRNRRKTVRSAADIKIVKSEREDLKSGIHFLIFSDKDQYRSFYFGIL